jgi:hypothetical protein
MRDFSIFVWALLTVWLPLAGGDAIRPPGGGEYPVTMIDPVVHAFDDGDAIRSFFQENGYVVVDGVSDAADRDGVVLLIDQIMAANIPHCRRLGFLDLYHDDTLAQLRQDPRVHEVFASIFESPELWVVFDRVIHQKVDEGQDPLPPHVDQNPIVDSGFSNLQAMLALRDMDESTGTLAVIPKSFEFFSEYAQWTAPGVGYVEYQGERELNFVGVRLKEGQMVIWDSRTTHSRFRGEPEADRYAALITFTPAKTDSDLVELRLKHYLEGTGWNNHHAGLRATARPRCELPLRQTLEDLSPLGEKLYGITPW